MTESTPGVVHHSDLDYLEHIRYRDSSPSERAVRREAADRSAFAYARVAVDAYYPGMDSSEIRMLAAELVLVVRDEESRRGAHYDRYRLMTRAALGEPLFTERTSGLTFPERGLIDLSERVGSMDPTTYAFAKDLYRGKGISAELGYVDQLGDWDAVGPLDRTMRALPSSEALQEHGFMFDSLYDQKDHAKLDYTFNVTGSLRHPVVVAKRKRAAADVRSGSNGDGEFQLVKHSSFLVSERLLGEPEQRMLDRVKEFGDIKRPTTRERSLFDGAVEEAGMTIVEPLISDRDMRERHAGVIAATSLYFALHRHR